MTSYPVDMTQKPEVHGFFDPATNTISYIVRDPSSTSCAIVDSVMDIDYAAGRITHAHADELIAFIKEKGWTLEWQIETHVHADHLSGAPYIKLKTGAKVAIGERIREVQKIFRPVFNAMDVSGEGAEFDMLFKDGDRFEIGSLTGEVIATPGHTPACVSYRIADAVFVGDTLFMPDYGTARADFPGGDARTLYRSIRHLLSLPGETRLFMCHDYLPKDGRTHYAWETTVAEERARNVHVREGVSEEDFVKMRTTRDATLSAPALLMPSIQVNMRAGKLPPADSNGVHYLRIPITLPQ